MFSLVSLSGVLSCVTLWCSLKCHSLVFSLVSLSGVLSSVILWSFLKCHFLVSFPESALLMLMSQCRSIPFVMRTSKCFALQIQHCCAEWSVKYESDCICIAICVCDCIGICVCVGSVSCWSAAGAGQVKGECDEWETSACKKPSQYHHCCYSLCKVLHCTRRCIHSTLMCLDLHCIVRSGMQVLTINCGN